MDKFVIKKARATKCKDIYRMIPQAAAAGPSTQTAGVTEKPTAAAPTNS